MCEQVFVCSIIIKEWLIEGASHAPLPRSRLTGYVCHECRQKLTKFVSINQPLLSVYAHPTSLIWTVYACGGGGTKVGQLYFLLLVSEAIPTYQLLSYLHNYIKKLWLWHIVDDISVVAMKTAVIYAPVDLGGRKKKCYIAFFNTVRNEIKLQFTFQKVRFWSCKVTIKQK